jgi:prepilin-type N-terminal cleavage/methylation domain-containing protein
MIMLERIRRARRDESGFTLIELLIVIVILGILAAIVVFAVNGIQDRGTASACKADVETVTVAAEAYDAQHGQYADDMNQLVKAGLLHSVPSSSSYTVDYKVSGDPGSSQRVSVSSDYCADAASDPSTDVPSSTVTSSSHAGIDPGSPYCTELGSAVEQFQGIDIDTLGDDGYAAWVAEFHQLESLASDNVAADWANVTSGLEQEHAILVDRGLSWSDLATLDSGGTPGDLSQDEANALQSELQQALSDAGVDAGFTDIGINARSICGLQVDGG